MKKKIISYAAISLCSLMLIGCEPGHNTPGSTVIGAAAGGLLGGAIFGSSAAGIIGGALLGGSVGYVIGRHMDRQDRINMQSAIVHTPVNEEATWTNTRTETTYVVRPIREYHRNGRICRRYKTRVKIEGRWRTAFGTVCKVPGGRWHIVSS